MSNHLPVRLPVPEYLRTCPSICPWVTTYLSAYLFVSTCLPVPCLLSTHLPARPSVHPSVWPLSSVHTSYFGALYLFEVQAAAKCRKHSTFTCWLWVKSCTVVMLLTFILSIPSPPHSFIPDLKPSFSANSPHRSIPFFFRTDYMDSPDCLLLLLSIFVFTF